MSKKKIKMSSVAPSSSSLDFPSVDAEQYKKAEPFPHIVIENFWDQDELASAVGEVEQMPEFVWTGQLDPTSNDCAVQKKKMALNAPEMLEGHAPTMQKVMRALNSNEMLEWLSKLTGIENLQCDEYNLGGGIHRSRRGGKLSVHADFNVHPETQKHRRINLLLYLNRDWPAEYKGDLELWRSDMSECVQAIAPTFNRAVIFNTTDDALHGHPEKLMCPEERSRLSLAFYYYTEDRPDNEKAPPHMAVWYKRPGKGF